MADNNEELKSWLIGIAAFAAGVILLFVFYQSTQPSNTSTSLRPTSTTSLSDAQQFCSDGLKGSLETIDADGHEAWLWFWKGIVEGYNLVNCKTSIDEYLSSSNIQLPQTPQTFVYTLGTSPVTLTAP